MIACSWEVIGPDVGYPILPVDLNQLHRMCSSGYPLTKRHPWAVSSRDPAARLRQQHERRKRHGDDGRRVAPPDEQPGRAPGGRRIDERPVTSQPRPPAQSATSASVRMKNTNAAMVASRLMTLVNVRPNVRSGRRL